MPLDGIKEREGERAQAGSLLISIEPISTNSAFQGQSLANFSIRMSTRHDQTGDWIRSNPRKTGGFCLLLGGFFIYQFMIKPMREAAAHAAHVSLSFKACGLCIFFVVFGLALILGGAPIAAALRPAPGDSRVAAFTVGGVIAAIGLGAFFLLKSHIESLGYVYRYFPYESTISPPAPSAASSSTAPSSAAWTVATAQKEAMRRYPQLGVANSPMNRAFVARYQQIKAKDPSYLRDPSWPLHLADEVGQQIQRQ